VKVNTKPICGKRKNHLFVVVKVEDAMMTLEKVT